MITIKKETRDVDVIDKIICNKCKKEIDPSNTDDIYEYQELFSYQEMPGYTSKFGDSCHYRVHLCNSCWYEIIKDYVEYTDEGMYE